VLSGQSRIRQQIHLPSREKIDFIRFDIQPPDLRTLNSMRPNLARTFTMLWVLFPICLAEANSFSTIFTFPPGKLQASKLIQGSDGNFYGTTRMGGAHFKGSIFKVTPAGVVTSLYDFTGHSNGAFPSGGVVEGLDGNFYGSTTSDLPASSGTIFKITPGGVLTTIYHFSGNTQGDGNDPSALIRGTGGNFYGTTLTGGFGAGIVFKVTSTGTFTIVCKLPDGGNAFPENPLVQGTDGNFYGICSQGGSDSGGFAFKVTPAGAAAVLHSFPVHSGRISALVQASDGNFYGLRERDGSHGEGLIYRLTPAGGFSVLHNFAGSTDGTRPKGALVQASDGNLYGTTTTSGPGGGGTVFRLTLTGAFANVKSFSSDLTQPRSPEVTLSNAADGKIYGVTSLGGDNNRGSIFNVTTGGALSVVASLPGYTLGANPTSLTQGAGMLVGTTSAGGLHNDGTIFRRASSGVVTNLHSFSSSVDGAVPSRLIRAKDGNFYGTTSTGSGALTAGTIFKITSAGIFTTLATFPANLSKGAKPSHLVQATDGAFYGTTQTGGTYGKGTVFKCTPTGALTMLHAFSGGVDGASPEAALIQAKDGNLYGLTPSGGSHLLGTIFKLSLSGTLTTIYNLTEALGPQFPLVQSYDGNFYGVFGAGGSSGTGMFFRVTPSGAFSLLWDFSGSSGPGVFPFGPLVQDPDGRFYGITTFGGIGFGPLISGGTGTLFRFSSVGMEVLYAFSDSHPTDTGPASSIVQASDGNYYGTTADTDSFGESRNAGGTLFQLAFRPSLFSNISTRLNVGTGEKVLIGGFIITGSQSKNVILRGLGPSLTSFHLTGVLANPVLELHNAAGQLIATNDDWNTNANRQAIIDSGLSPTNSKESAILTTLNPGAYTAILRGANNSTGIGLVEAYDLNTAAASKFVNISTRGYVQTGDNVMIGGFVILGDDFDVTRVAVRAIGPSLSQQGVNHPLADPVLELHDSQGDLIESNDNWTDTERDMIQTTGLAPNNVHESVIVTTLVNGRYTAIVRGKNGSTGIALIEVYKIRF
jgi:uncharacterized repeat protein (TIGR03803 family)